ncbi:hypothetical protein D3C76_1590760 [compost metagenome]
MFRGVRIYPLKILALDVPYLPVVATQEGCLVLEADVLDDDDLCIVGHLATGLQGFQWALGAQLVIVGEHLIGIALEEVDSFLGGEAPSSVIGVQLSRVAELLNCEVEEGSGCQDERGIYTSV